MLICGCDAASARNTKYRNAIPNPIVIHRLKCLSDCAKIIVERKSFERTELSLFLSRLIGNFYNLLKILNGLISN